MLIALAVPPVLVVYGFSLFFLNATIDNWFNVRLEQALNDALEIGRVYLDERLHVAEQSSTTLAAELAPLGDPELQARLDNALDAQGATQLTVFGDNRAVLATASSDPRFLDPAYPDSAALLQMRNSGRYAAAEPVGADDQLMLRVVVPLPAKEPDSQRLLQALFPLPEAIAAADRRGREGELRFPAPEIPARLAEADVHAGADVRAAAVGAVRAADGVRRRAPPDRADRPSCRGDARRRRRPLRHAAAGQRAMTNSASCSTRSTRCSANSSSPMRAHGAAPRRPKASAAI